MKIRSKIMTIAALALMAFTGDVLTQLNLEQSEATHYMFEAVKTNSVYFKSELVDKARSLSTDARVACTRELVQMAKAYTKTDEFASEYKKYRTKMLYGKVKRGFGLPSASSLLSKAADKVMNNSTDDGTKNLPADPQEMVKRRLENFMKVSAEVDFSAKTAGGEFVDEEYRKKSGQWKMYYRAGKPVITAAREEVAAWLAELQ